MKKRKKNWSNILGYVRVITVGVLMVGCSTDDDMKLPVVNETIPNGFFEDWVSIPKKTLSGKEYIKDSLVYWQESIVNIIGRAQTGVGIVNKYTGSDANGTALFLKRGDGDWATESRNSVFTKFELKLKPKKIKGRYKFKGSNKSNGLDKGVDTLKIQVYFSKRLNAIETSQLVTGLFPENSREFIVTTPTTTFTSFEIDINDFPEEDYEIAYIQFVMNIGKLNLAEYGGEFSEAVIDDLSFTY
ncbi:hypothetical protein [Pontimicrobium sp. SW4]|uniref:Uncharacterized protein n=1 Tax=Pontimicrobium sp. SW4 TaxID=3153519 RepID=A0AAU7BPR1_9FLAO